MRPFLIVVPQLGGDEELIAVDASAVQRIADAGLILVRGGGVKRAITDFQRLMNGGDDFLVASFPHAETQLRHQVAVVQFYNGWMCHAFLLLMNSAKQDPPRGSIQAGRNS